MAGFQAHLLMTQAVGIYQHSDTAEREGESDVHTLPSLRMQAAAASAAPTQTGATQVYTDNILSTRTPPHQTKTDTSKRKNKHKSAALLKSGGLHIPRAKKHCGNNTGDDMLSLFGHEDIPCLKKADGD